MPISSNRWSGASVLPYGPGWGASTPGGVASCMTWDAANGSAPYRPASASMASSSGEAPYFLRPNLSYERRMGGGLLMLPAAGVPSPAANHSTQAPESFRRGPPPPPARCCCGSDARQHRRTHRCGNEVDDGYDGPPVAAAAAETWTSCNRCSDVVRATNAATGCNYCERCRHSDHRLTPRPPRIVRKEVQFAQENNSSSNHSNRGRVIEILEDRQGNPVKMTITRPTTAVNRPYTAARENTDQNDRWATRKRYVQPDPEMTSPTTGCDAGDLRQIVADDVKRLLDVYQAGKADASFLHKGGIISPKWSNSNGRPEHLEETYVEERRQNVTTSGNRWRDDAVPIRTGYPERRTGYGLQESRTVVSRLQHHHGVRRDFPRDVSSPNDKVKVQVECPANGDTIVNLRVRASDVDYQFR